MWLTTPPRKHDSKGYIVVHFQKLGMKTSYQHDLHPNDYFFEDFDCFENVLERMVAHNFPAAMLASLGQDPKLE